MLRSGIRRLFSYKLPGKISSSYETIGEINLPKGYIRPVEIYKPSKTINFNKEGEILVYSNDPQSQASVFFPVPWSLGTWSIPLQAFAWHLGAFGSFGWLAPITMYLGLLPHCWYLYELRFRAEKVWYIRGGMWKMENCGPYRLRTLTCTEPRNIEILNNNGEIDLLGGKELDILNENGELINDLNFKTHYWQEYYESIEGRKFSIGKLGKVRNPELFQAMVQGYKIDDSDFTMNYDRDVELAEN